jgi:hypothetical protein
LGCRYGRVCGQRGGPGRPAQYLVPDRRLFHSRADGHDDPGELVALAGGELHREQITDHPGADHRVEGVDAGGTNLDDDFTGSRLGHRDIGAASLALVPVKKGPDGTPRGNCGSQLRRAGTHRESGSCSHHPWVPSRLMG